MVALCTGKFSGNFPQPTDLFIMTLSTSHPFMLNGRSRPVPNFSVFDPF